MKMIFDIILASGFTAEKGEEKMGNEKNVLLISMSTMSNQDKNYYYILHSDNDPDFYTGISSMAAGTKHVLHRLARGGRKLDKIIVLTTPEANEDCALDNYKEEIKSFIKNGDVISDIKDAKCGNKVRENIVSIAPEKTEGACCSVEEFEQMICQIDIPSPNDDLSYSAIPKIVNEVSSLRVNDSKVNLFLDMQGGSRVSTFIINSAVNMMRDGDNVRLERSYATLYNRKYQVHQLRDESMSNHVFDLVSGMDEFLNYGKAKKFLEYYDFYRNVYIRENEGNSKYPEEDIVKSIESISNAIGITNVDGFYSGLNDLKVAIDNYRKNTVDTKDDLFVGFVDRIEESYEGILDTNRRAIDVMDWCIEKEWYQQALTVCESKMPELFVRDKVVYYCKTLADKPKEIKKLKDYYNSSDNDYKKNNADVNLFVIKKYEYKFISPTNPSTRPKPWRPNSLYDLIFDNKLYSDYWAQSVRRKTMSMLRKYFDICRFRNSVNHGDSQSVQMVDMINKMKDFVTEYRELVGDDWKDANKQFDFSTLEIKYNDIKP